MKKNNGFIAISLIYSFFLVFLMTMLAISADYMHNRILLNKVKKSTIEYLNNLSEFDLYPKGSLISLANEQWIIVDNTDKESVTLILTRPLSYEELKMGMVNYDDYIIRDVIANQDMAMYYKRTFYWSSTLVREVVKKWLENNPDLMKEKDNGNLKVTYTEYNQDDYIRIPTKAELDEATNFIIINNVWMMDDFSNANNLLGKKKVMPIIKVVKKIIAENNTTDNQ